MDFEDQVEALIARFGDIATERTNIAGVDDIVLGLSKIATYMQSTDDLDDQRFAIILRTLSTLADFLNPEFRESPEPGEYPEAETRVVNMNFDHMALPKDDETQVASPGLEQFIETFRRESRKRIQGLSTTLMNIFGEDGNDDSINRTVDHLHAIRGGAAMLGLEDIAQLAGAMEELVLAKKELLPDQRDWPTKTLLRAFALIQTAIDADPLQLDTEQAPAVVLHLRRAANHTPTEEAPTEEPVSVEEFDSALSKKVAPKSLEQPILIVDDVDTIAASVAFILSELEVPIEIASQGEEAMQLLKERAFSLVISDVDMPRMDGIALTRMIRSTEETRQIPVILLTSLDHPEERQAGIAAGATDYLIKGTIGGGELVKKVREVLKTAPFVQREIQQKTRRILIAEDTETVAASIAFVLSEGPFDIILATDGKDALRMLQKSSYDLLITDMQMPYMSGTELVQAVRADEGLKSLPVIMLTSVQKQEAMAEAAEAGVDRYLIKGEIAGGKLLSVVEEILGNSEA